MACMRRVLKSSVSGKSVVSGAAVALAMMLCPPPGLAEEVAGPAAAQPPGPAYTLPETETFTLPAQDGYPYQIFISMPKGAPPPDGYPVLYVLDGNAMFAGFAETRRILAYTESDLGKTIVVGIGYDTENAYDVRRIYDLTPEYQTPIMPALESLKDYKAGGRDQFASYILERLRPELARRYSVNPHRQALFGHSLGGLFGLYMLYRHPTEFHAIISASPTIFWNDQEILGPERSFTERLRKGQIKGPVSRLRIVTGDLDETVVEHTDGVALAKRLEALSADGLRSELEVFKGEVHITVPSRSVTSTMRFAFAWP